MAEEKKRNFKDCKLSMVKENKGGTGDKKF